MKNPKNILLLVLALAVFILIGIIAFRPAPTIHTINPRLKQLQDSLAQSAAQKAAMETAYADSMRQLRQREKELLADTANHKLISRNYDNIRKANRSMEMDTAVTLLHHRLRIEDRYSTRFNYSN